MGTITISELLIWYNIGIASYMVLASVFDLLFFLIYYPKGDYNMDDFGDEVETDAVHPRLAHHGGRKPSKTAESCTYQCYDCGLLFQSLTQLLHHSPWHGSERCLKCLEPITVYIQTKSSVYFLINFYDF